ncbi:MAG: phage tail sheath family protein [Roseovarius sp.]
MSDIPKTPGVYIVEKSAFPNSVVEVATGVPVFIGYTQRATRGPQDLTNHPMRITSMSDFEQFYGTQCPPQVEVILDEGVLSFKWTDATRFNMFNAMRLFFNNGGGVCWIVSVGDYGTAKTPRAKAADDFKAALPALEATPEPTMVVTPDAVLLAQADHTILANACLDHCVKMQNRIALLDVYNGDQPRSLGSDDVISGDAGFRKLITSDELGYGAVYYPWVYTDLTEDNAFDYTVVTPATRSALQDAVAADKGMTPSTEAKALINALTDTKANAADIKRTHQALLAQSAVYSDAIKRLLEMLNIMPPSAAMAGVIARTDAHFGVWKAPANTGLASVVGPTVPLSDAEQDDLNVPLDGKAINTIRSFVNRGVLVWGARTLDGNSQDWRYVSVRRTMIFLEQSIWFAAQAYVFSPNTSSTWITVQNMIRNFLNNQWKAGALTGATPDEAYDVSVGLGSTMNGDDTLDGYMQITVHVAVTRPAEFNVITFQQKMQTS